MNVSKLISVTFFTLAITAFGARAQTKTTPVALPNYQAAADYSADHRGLAVLVYKSGKLVFEEYQNGHTAETPWMLASGTKSFSGVMLAAAIEDKLISGFDEKVSDTITEWRPDPRRSKITIRQLLSLTSGIDAGTIAVPPEYSKAIMFPAKFEPGTRFQYGPVPFQVFGELMRRKLILKNETVLQYLKRRILDTIGLKVSRWNEQAGQPNLPSGAFLTAREWAKFGILLQNGGRWNGRQIVAKKLLEELVIGSNANPNYGITFWLNRPPSGNDIGGGRLREVLGGRERPVRSVSKNGIDKTIAPELYMAAGAANQRLYIIPSQDMVIVRQGRLGEWDDSEFLNRLLP
jgi:CubicO group peptidase (beta-lactamase class C family)